MTHITLMKQINHAVDLLLDTIEILMFRLGEKVL